jgi:hypothetical protein
MLIIGGMELVTCLIANYFCDRMYRKISIIILMIIAGCVGIFIQFTSTKSGI